MQANNPKEKNSSERRKALEAAVSAIEKQFGKGSIMQLGKDEVDRSIDSIPSGSLSLDLALGVKGYPKGRIVEVYGPESSGKTTLTLHAVAEAQKKGDVCAFIDAEHALDTSYAKKIGVDLDELMISQPDTGEQALDIVEMLVKSNAVDVVVVDSVAALTPKAELEGEMGDRHVGLQARLMSQALRKLTAAVSRSNSTVIFINQLRMKIGVMFGNPETTTGGNALKFYSSVRLDIRRIASIKQADEVLGNRVRVKVVKNKVAAPFRQAEFDIMFNEGISYIGDLLDLGVDKGVVKKSGSWFSFGEERLGQGREGVKEFLRENPEILQRVDGAVKVALGMAQPQGEQGKNSAKKAEEDAPQKRAGASGKDATASARSGAKAAATKRASAKQG